MKLQLMCSHKFWEGCGYVTTLYYLSFITVTYLFIYLIFIYLIEQPLTKRIISWCGQTINKTQTHK